MCGRFALSAHTDEVEKLLPSLYSESEIEPRYNIAPSQSIATILNDSPKEISFVHWGLIPSWSKDKSVSSKMINARAETLIIKPAFKRLYRNKRCLIIADGFYEWKKDTGTKKKTPYFIKLKSGEPFTFAGLWDTWTEPTTNQKIISAVIITTVPSRKIKEIHDRMPVIIPKEDRLLWLNSETDIGYLDKLFSPYPDEDIEIFEVSTAVNAPGNNDPRSIFSGRF
jgi:putative SOS response-associated peptidase YedK